jgi:hypothetical protein
VPGLVIRMSLVSMQMADLMLDHLRLPENKRLYLNKING